MHSSHCIYDGESTNIYVNEVKNCLRRFKTSRSTRSSSCLTFSRPPVTSHLMFSNRAISITVPRLWNDLPPELRTISSPPLPSLPITRHPPPLSHLFHHSYLNPPHHSPSP